MEMCYNGTLVMPKNCTVINCVEMEYIDAGATVKVVLKKDFLRDVVTASCCAIGTIVGAIIGSALGPTYGSIIGGAVGGALGWVVGGTLSRAYINKDLCFDVWVPFVSKRTFTIW